MKAQLVKVIRKPAKMQIRVKEMIMTDTYNKSTLLGCDVLVFWLCSSKYDRDHAECAAFLF